MIDGFVFLDECGFVYKGIMIIPNGRYIVLSESKLERIDSTIKGVL